MNEQVFCSLPLLGEKIPTAGNCGVTLNSLSQCLSLVDTVTLYKTPFTLHRWPYVDVRRRCNRERLILRQRWHTLRRRTSTDETCRTNRARQKLVELYWFYYRSCMECRRGRAMRILSVRLSVRLSVKRVISDKTKESCVGILVPHERSFTLVLWQEEWLVGRPLVPEILGQTDRVGTKSPIFSRYSLVAPQS